MLIILSSIYLISHEADQVNERQTGSATQCMIGRGVDLQNKTGLVEL